MHPIYPRPPEFVRLKEQGASRCMRFNRRTEGVAATCPNVLP